MLRRIQPRDTDPDSSFRRRCVAAFVALLLFTPVLILLWLLGNLEFAWLGGWQAPGEVLLGAVAAAALPGFMMPRVTPTVFGWVASGFHRLAVLALTAGGARVRAWYARNHHGCASFDSWWCN